MKRVIQLKTSRVYAHSPSGEPKVETVVIKLEDGDNFNKFLKNIHTKGYMESRPPEILKVLDRKSEFEIKDGKKTEKNVQWVESSKDAYVEALNKALKPVSQDKGAADIESLKNENVELKKKLDEILSKLEEKPQEQDEELEAAREEYKELFGKLPTKNMKLETVKQKIEDKLNS